MTKSKDTAMDRSRKIIREQRKLLRIKLRKANKPIFNKIHKVEDKEDEICGKAKEIYDRCEEKELKKRGYTDEKLRRMDFDRSVDLLDEIRDICGEEPEYKRWNNECKKMVKKHSDLLDNLANNEHTVEFSLPLPNDISVSLTGNFEYNPDVGGYMFEHRANITIGDRTYWWHNVFDGGDVYGKKNCKANWYVKETLDDADPECIPDIIDEKNFETIESLLAIGIRM